MKTDNYGNLPQERKWIPVERELPPIDVCILLSFYNYPLPEVGWYDIDKEGSGAFYVGDDDMPCSSVGLFVNAWMPLPKRYEEEDV